MSKKIALTILTVCLISVVVVPAFFYVNINFFHVTFSSSQKVLRFASTSMEPTIMEGNFILIETNFNPSELNSNYPYSDIIAFHNPNNPNVVIAHRIVSQTTLNGAVYFQTKGDANSNRWPSAVTPDEYDSNTLWSTGQGIPENLVIGKVIDTDYKWP